MKNDSKQEPRKVTVHLTGPGAHFVTGTAEATPPSALNLWIASNATWVEWTVQS